MKRLLSLLLALPLNLALAATPASLLKEGQQAMQKGNFEAAKAKFEEVLLVDPKNPAAKNLLRLAESQIKSNPRGPQVAALKQLIIPSINFDNATLGSALEALKKKAAEASNGKITPNFVIAPGVDPATPVTLKLQDVPLEVILNYISKLAKISVTYEPYAVSFSPLTETPMAPR